MKLLALVVLLGALHPAPASATPFCRAPVAKATWTDEPQGARIKVFPTSCGRRTTWLAPRAVFRVALAAGGRRARHRRSLYDQFRCHAVFAPVKRSWNLETWRPVVTPKRMVAALCNPTGRPDRRTRGVSATGLIAQIVTALQHG